MKRVRKTVKVKNRLGLHARPATMMAKLLQGYSSSVTLAYKDQVVDARSIMSLLMLAVKKNSTIELIAEGPDAVEVMEKLVSAFSNEFGEKRP